jgi:ATP-dependent Clp protease, protease subunit
MCRRCAGHSRRPRVPTEKNTVPRKIRTAITDILTQEPAIRVYGAVDEAFLGRFLEQLKPLRGRTGPLVFELSTTGGDADLARRIAEEIRLCREIGGMDLYFVGKAMVYSAGVMIMAAFPVQRRFLSRDAVLLIHAWQIEKEIRFSGALQVCAASAHDFLAELEVARKLEHQTFSDLVQGTELSYEQLSEQVSKADWYLLADEARSLGLVSGLV